MGLQTCDITDQGELTIDSAGATGMVDQYTAIMESVRDTRRQLVDALPALQRGAPHDTEPGLYVSSFEARQDEHSPIWRLRVSYSDQVEDDNPLAEPADINMKSQRLESYTLLDNKGRIMLNTAGVPFEPQPKGETLWVISVRKNVADYPAWLLEYPEAINNDTVRIRKLNCKPGTLAITGLSIPDYVTSDKAKIKYLPLEFEVTYRKSGWHTVVPSRGFSERIAHTPYTWVNVMGNPLVPGTSVYFSQRRILSDRGEPITEPMLLDRDGKAIRNPKPEDVVTVKFTIPDEKPFSTLPFK